MLALASCAQIRQRPYHYRYHIVYDMQGRVTDVKATSRLDLSFDNCTGVHTLRTAPEAPSSVFKEVFDGISQFLGNIFGSIF
jgi:hypothetical protein